MEGAFAFSVTLSAGSFGMGAIRVAIAGVGNCASALIQGLSYYRSVADADRPAGLARVEVAGYRPADVAVVAAFDVSAEKVGLDVADAIWAPPNETARFAAVERMGVTVLRGPTLDGIGPTLAPIVPESPAPACDVAAALKRAGAEVLVSFLPVGADRATQAYAEAALAARCAFVNCIPSFIASDPAWARRFENAGLPVIGDDVKSQVGATIVHRAIAALCEARGAPVRRTMQLNVGGNADFQNMLDRTRLASKKVSKTRAVATLIDAAADDVHIGPSDHVPWLTDRKWAYIRLEAQGFGGLPIAIELKLEVWDSPNSAGVVIDAIRCAKLALDRGVRGALAGPSAWFMKSPPQPMSDEAALVALERFIAGDA